MSKSNYLENQFLANLFNNAALGYASDTTFYVALHSSDPGEAGTQDTNEISYTGYARVGVARNSGGFTVSGATVTNTAQVQFPICTGGTATATHFSIGRLTSGAGDIFYKGALNSSLAISNNVQPQFAATALSITED
jgi:hypothetical protein